MDREGRRRDWLDGPAGVLAVWAFLSALWAVHAVEYADSSVGEAVWSGVTSMGLATLLSLGVWALTVALPWPDRLTPRFLALHLGLGALYAALWILAGHFLSLIVQGRGTLAGLVQAGVLGWRFSMGLLLYGVAAGVSYTVRTRRRLRAQELRASEAEALAAQSRLQAIRAQMDPHFLFNALHSVSSLIDTDPEAAQVALEGLGELLRYSLDEDEGEVLLSQEWDFTRNYLEIEGLRLGDRLVLETELEEGVLSRVVPSFSVQTLVENAIRHGVARGTAPRTRVGIRIGEEDGDLVIRVDDDGPGAERASIEGSTGRGLLSIRERIRTLYGEGARLEIDTAPGAGFSAMLRIPSEEGRAEQIHTEEVGGASR